MKRKDLVNIVFKNKYLGFLHVILPLIILGAILTEQSINKNKVWLVVLIIIITTINCWNLIFNEGSKNE